MKQQALLQVPLLPILIPTQAVAAHAVAVTTVIGAELHALAINVDIPLISNASSSLLLNVPEEETSSKNGEHLLALVKDHGSSAEVGVTANAVAAKLSFLGERRRLMLATSTAQCSVGKLAIQPRG